MVAAFEVFIVRLTLVLTVPGTTGPTYPLGDKFNNQQGDSFQTVPTVPSVSQCRPRPGALHRHQ